MANTSLLEHSGENEGMYKKTGEHGSDITKSINYTFGKVG
jgi:hypothetical protein